MKGSRKEETKQSKQGRTNRPLPEIRDNLDSRKNEEFPTNEDLKKGKKLKEDKSEHRHRS